MKDEKTRQDREKTENETNITYTTANGSSIDDTTETETCISHKTERETSIAYKIDDLLSQLGKPGRYQLFIFLLLLLNYFPVVFNQLIGAFYSAQADHTCDVTRGTSSDILGGDSNYTIQEKKTTACETLLTLNNGSNISLACRHGDWIYHIEDRERTIVTEWDLVCDDAYLRPLSTTIYFCGVMIGGLVLGYLSDMVGRRPIMLVTLYAPIAFGVGIFFTPSYIWYACARFMEGIFVQSLQMTSYIIVVELFLPEYRPIVGALMECMWGVSIIVLGGIAYLIRDWRYIQLAITLPRILAVFYICVIPESPRWMIMHGKLDEAEKLVDKISRFNNVDFPSRSWQSVKIMTEKMTRQQNPRNRFLELVTNKLVRKRSLILFYIWFAEAACYYGLTYLITSLAGNKYLNFFIGACVEMAAHLLNIFLLKKINRRVTFISYAGLAAVTCITAGSLPSVTVLGVDLAVVSTGFATVGRFAVAGLYSVIYLYTSELYPTVIRNIGMGTCGFWTRLGGVIAPQINSLGKSGSFAVIVFGVMMLISALLTLMLPETNGRKLPDTIEDLERDMICTEIIVNAQDDITDKDILTETEEKTANGVL